MLFIQKNFSITNEQYKKIKEWAETHECRFRCGDRPSHSCIGGEISVIFTPTSIGTFVTAKCECGSEIAFDDDV